MNKKSGILLSDDLIFTSRIQATARAHGLQVQAARSLEQLLKFASDAEPTGVILDLHHTQLDLPVLLNELRSRCQSMPRVTGYGSHVDAERLRKARQAGCDQVLPRSQFVQELETRITDWLSPRVESVDGTTESSPRPPSET